MMYNLGIKQRNKEPARARTLKPYPQEFDFSTGNGLEQIASGFYVDATGQHYFYLTGMYSLVTDRILEFPFLNTPSFVTNVLDGLRQELEKMKCTELMD
jgi:hypothetical protein